MNKRLYLFNKEITSRYTMGLTWGGDLRSKKINLDYYDGRVLIGNLTAFQPYLSGESYTRLRVVSI